MKKVATILTFVLLNVLLFAQKDSIPKVQNTRVEIYDVVAVYREHVDGRGVTRQYTSEMKGKILNYDESTGVLTFKARDGKMYSLKSTDYKYFEYDKEFTSKNKQVVQLDRKDSGFEINVGLNVGYFTINHNFIADDFYINGIDSNADIPICLKLGVGKYLNKNSLVGINAEYALVIDNNSYFNIGTRYQYMYNPSKNKAFYFPIELKFSRYQFNSQYQTSDTTFIDNFSWEYPTQLDTEITTNNIELNIGQGISFALKNKKSLTLELLLLKQFAMQQTFKNESGVSPNSEYGITGLKLAACMNF